MPFLISLTCLFFNFFSCYIIINRQIYLNIKRRKFDIIKPKSSYADIFKKTARVSAWVLLVCVIMLLFSGWGITQTGAIYSISFGLIDRRLADSIHKALNIPLAFFFLLHVLINIKLALKFRHTFIKWTTNVILIIIGCGVLWIVIYMDLIRRGG
jgi:hypothetical protein